MNKAILLLCVIGIMAFALDLMRCADDFETDIEPADETIVFDDFIRVSFDQHCMMFNFSEIALYKTNEDFERLEPVNRTFRTETGSPLNFKLPQEGMHWLEVKNVFGDSISRIVDFHKSTHVLFEDMLDYLYPEGDFYTMISGTDDLITIYSERQDYCYKSGGIHILRDASDRNKLHVQYIDDIDTYNEFIHTVDYVVHKDFLMDLIKIERNLRSQTQSSRSNKGEYITIVVNNIYKTFYRGINNQSFKKQVLDLIKIHEVE